MALISCRGCSKKISDKAPRCPHCGLERHLVVQPLKVTQPPTSTPPVNIPKSAPPVSPNIIYHKNSSQGNGMVWIFLVVSLVVASAIAGIFFWRLTMRKEALKYELDRIDSIVSVQRAYNARLDELRTDSIDAENEKRHKP